jgi:hypothetical protein
MLLHSFRKLLMSLLTGGVPVNITDSDGLYVALASSANEDLSIY